MTEYHAQPTETTVSVFAPLLSDDELAGILVMTVDWIRAHSSTIPGLERLGMYYRFHRKPIERWLGSLDQLLTVEQVSQLLKVPASWVYANADQIPGVLRLGRYVRFRPTTIKQFLGGSEACQ